MKLARRESGWFLRMGRPLHLPCCSLSPGAPGTQRLACSADGLRVRLNAHSPHDTDSKLMARYKGTDIPQTGRDGIPIRRWPLAGWRVNLDLLAGGLTNHTLTCGTYAISSHTACLASPRAAELASELELQAHPCSRRVRRVKSSAVCPPSRHLISANSGRLLGNTFCSATWRTSRPTPLARRSLRGWMISVARTHRTGAAPAQL